MDPTEAYARFTDNVARVRNLVDLYEFLGAGTPGRRPNKLRMCSARRSSSFTLRSRSSFDSSQSMASCFAPCFVQNQPERLRKPARSNSWSVWSLVSHLGGMIHTIQFERAMSAFFFRFSPVWLPLLDRGLIADNGRPSQARRGRRGARAKSLGVASVATRVLALGVWH